MAATIEKEKDEYNEGREAISKLLNWANDESKEETP